MSEIAFEVRVKAVGLRLAPEELPKLQALVSDLDRAALGLRTARPYWEEPLSGFRLTPAT